MAVREQKRAGPAVSLNERLFHLDDSRGGRPVLLGGRCPECGCHFFPSRAICAGCGRVGLETAELSGTGKIWTYTVAHQTPPGAVVQSPHIIAQVELPESVLVTSLITSCEPTDARVGMKVEIIPMKVQEDDEGRDVLAFAFQPLGMTEEPE